jgi:YidC/Oxa1 family membrane protein insertase
MPREKNTTARIVVPIVALVGAVAIGYLTVRSTKSTLPTPPAQTETIQPTSAQETPPTTDGVADVAATNETTLVEDVAAQDTAQVEGQIPDEATTAAVQPVAGEALRVRLVAPAPQGLLPLGGDDERLVIHFSPVGAGVESITLTEYFETLKREVPYSVQERQQVGGYTVASLASRGVTINGTFVDLLASGRDDAWVWSQTGVGQFETLIENEQGEGVARITKQFFLRSGSFDIHVDQHLENMTDGPLEVRWVQYGPVDLPKDEGTYGGDKRRVFFGHLIDPVKDPTREYVQPTKQLVRQKVLQNYDKSSRLLRSTKLNPAEPLVWAAMTNRYFAFAVHAPVPADGSAPVTGAEKRFMLGESVYSTVLTDVSTGQRVLVLELESGLMRVDAGESLDLSLGSYAGPLWRKTLGSEPAFVSLGLNRLLVYNFGGPCAFCTFQPLARALLWFLGTAHNYIVFDWGLAILLLVVVVRTILHPITKKSQIALQRFTKQMQGIGPKQKELQAKYKDQPKKLQGEMAALFREEGVQFRGALGCLPMFLQTPVWIALFAMLYFAFDLRHQPAFFGVFQAVSGGSWGFLSDLSAPDGMIPFGIGFNLPLMGNITSLNVLPLFLGIVFFLQQKYLTPPPSASTTPEQKSQQKIMKVMMVVMFPVFMYNAPSGLTLYFITNSSLGIMESRYIRAHIDQMDANPSKSTGRKKKVKNTSPRSPFGKKSDAGSSYKERKRK